jgi:hypothetical protein
MSSLGLGLWIVTRKANRIGRALKLQYWRFDPAECRFPRPCVPVLPRFPAGLLAVQKSTRYRSSFLKSGLASYTRGRYALTALLKSLGVEQGRTVLIPAYHCRTMIDPIVRLGGTPVFFGLQPDLTPDWKHVEDCVAATGQPVALLLPHYFGFPQQVEQVRAWCDKFGVAYVEDCSHALFGTLDGIPIGSMGDAAIASPYKFFASEDGGLVRGIKNGPLTMRSGPSVADELRGIWRSVQKFLQGGRNLPCDGPEDDLSCGDDVILEEEGISSQYALASENRQALRWSQLIMRLSSIDRIAQIRRRNYQAWLDATCDMPGCRPQFPCLPDSVVPYMFPLWLDDPARVFFRLKRAGLPIFRWDELAVSDCVVSRAARLGLIHLPCHQGIGQVEMNWMIEVLRRGLKNQAAP